MLDMSDPVLRSIQAGLPQERGAPEAADPNDRSWVTGFYKTPVVGPVRLRSDNLDGDGQADLENHGGRDKAVCVYSADHYGYWREALGFDELPFGAFGENFTVAGLVEDDVCIGDVWRVGDAAGDGAVVEVSQPRQPCWKLARRWRVKTLAAQVVENGRTGWYFRVVHEGVVAAGMSLTLVERPWPQWTVARANQVGHHKKDDVVVAAELAAVPQLSASWRGWLMRRVERGGEA